MGKKDDGDFLARFLVETDENNRKHKDFSTVIRELLENALAQEASLPARWGTPETTQFIRQAFPPETDITSVTFDEDQGVVTIAAELDAGPSSELGEILETIMEETGWEPILRNEVPAGETGGTNT